MSNINSHLLSKAFFTLYSPQQKQKTEIYNSSNSFQTRNIVYKNHPKNALTPRSRLVGRCGRYFH